MLLFRFRSSAALFLLSPILLEAQDCIDPPVMESVSVVAAASGSETPDAVLGIAMTSGQPVSLALTGMNGSGDYVLPMGSLDGVLPGYYSAAVLDVDGCSSNALALIVRYDLCCDGCGVYDQDGDGLCDDVDNCIDRLADNYADPGNSPCDEFNCLDPVSNVGSGYEASDLPCSSPILDGYLYDVVAIGSQCWFAENLRTTIYANGEPIQGNIDVQAWNLVLANSLAGRTVYGEFEPCVESAVQFDACNACQSLIEFGRLYNGFAMKDNRGICPTGWHVPEDEDWSQLKGHLEQAGYPDNPGHALKATSGWSNDGNGLDAVGFTGLAAGNRSIFGNYLNAGIFGVWWSSTPPSDTVQAKYWLLNGSSDDLISSQGPGIGLGLSIRCLENE